MDTSTSSSTGGIIAALRTLGDSLVGSLQDRIELVSVELQEEKLRLIRTFIWITAAVFSGMLAIMFASLTLVYVFWETARLTVFVSLTAFYTALVVTIIVGLRRYLAHQPQPFAATVQELGEDRACIRSES